jgi:hypothetical protein
VLGSKLETLSKYLIFMQVIESTLLATSLAFSPVEIPPNQFSTPDHLVYTTAARIVLAQEGDPSLETVEDITETEFYQAWQICSEQRTACTVNIDQIDTSEQVASSPDPSQVLATLERALGDLATGLINVGITKLQDPEDQSLVDISVVLSDNTMTITDTSTSEVLATVTYDSEGRCFTINEVAGDSSEPFGPIIIILPSIDSGLETEKTDPYELNETSPLIKGLNNEPIELAQLTDRVSEINLIDNESVDIGQSFDQREFDYFDFLE